MTAARRARGAAVVAAGLAVAGLAACDGGPELPGYGGGAPTTQEESSPTPTDGDTDDDRHMDDEDMGDGDHMDDEDMGDGDHMDDGHGDDGTGDDDPSGDTPFRADDRPDTGRASGDAALVITDVRVGAHDGYDRVVLDLGGTGSPGWRVEYVDRATDDGSGEPVDVDGDEVLQVRLSGMALPSDVSGVAEYDGGRVEPDGTEAVEEVVYRFWFEGYTTIFIGVDDPTDGARRPAFRVFALDDPARVVVDVRTTGP
ncbi:hypothetical protein [Isoptericola sp. BMS4]|uniref:AMIN-like domain-containing (lipo)protein n=1 Tax=Isoptericola sp. BMS4 TaxID=2527875 RepID=UPI001423C050|nr:hypothetical protein [Isoptericola sp. BMS4]